MSKILANQIANYGDDAPIEIKEGLNIPAGKPIQAAGSSGSSGQVLSTTGTSIEWVATFDGDYNSLTNKPTIPAAQVASDWNAVGGVSRILNKPIIPAQPSVTTATAGTPSLSYNTVNGEFTYTPPDISDMATETWVGSQGFLTAETDNLTSVTSRNQVTVQLDGGYGTKNCGFTGNHLLFGGLLIWENDLMNNGTGDRTLFGHRAGAITWCGDDGSGTTDWQNRKFELYHLDSSQSTSQWNALAGALYLKSDDGYPISIGNDTGDIQLGNNSGSIKYLTASSTATKLFYDGVEKLTTSLTGIDLGSNTLTTTGKLLYSNNYANAVDLPDASTYHGMFAHVHATGKGVFAHGGSWLSLVDETSSINELADVNTASNSDGYVLKWDAGTSTWKPQPDLVGSGGSGIVLSDLSVTTAAASGGGSLSYGNTTGVFTFTPPDLSGYVSTETDPIFNASAAAGITSSNIANWDAAYGWGNHASAGYLTAVSLSLTGLTDVSITPANLNSGDSIVWNGTQWIRTSQQFITSTPEITQNDSKAEVIGVGSDDGEFKVTLQDSTSGGAGATALRLHTDSSVNVIEFNEGNPAAKSRLVLNHLTTTNAWSEIHFKRTGASPGTSMIRSGGGGSGGYFQFYPVDGNVDFQVSGTGTYTRLNAIVDGSLTAGGLTYPSDVGTSGDVLTSDGAGNVTWQTPTGGGGGGGANVTISDTIPAGSPTAGDLWWESDTGRLKVYYTDVDSSQWVDASPPLADATSIGASGTVSMKAHILPDTNAAHDIGSAEYKIRHLFLSDNTLYHEGPFIKTAQHDAGGSAQTASYVITLAKLKEALNASSNFDDFKSAILAITDAT